MIPKSLLELLFEAASMQRWNDHIRPHKGFTELDKQAHKMFFAYVLAKTEQTGKGQAIAWRDLIEGGIFEFLHRIKLTDLKPTIFHELMKHKSCELNDWVLGELRESVQEIGDGFLVKFRSYLFDPGYCAAEKRILKAAHYLATNWEFEIIYRLNSTFYGLEETKARIENEIEDHFDLAGVQKIALRKKTHGFLDLVGQLRFQQRWAHSPRVPETSVLGHMLIVAVLSYLCSVELGACARRIANNFFGGLFHDLPEVLTRDILSPVKRSVAGLEEIIKDIEKRQIEERILTLLPEAWHGEIKFFLENEFQSKIILDGELTPCSAEEICARYNRDEYSPFDGELIKACDQLAAYIEAALSISSGIRSRHLKEGKEHIYERHAGVKIASFGFRQLFDYFQ